MIKIKSTKELKMFNLVLTKVEKQLYHQNGSLLSIPEELVVSVPIRVYNVVKKSRRKNHSSCSNYPRTNSPQQPIAISISEKPSAKTVNKVDPDRANKRKIVPVVMGDGEEYRPVKRRQLNDKNNTVSLNCNSNNNELNKLLPHDSHVIGLSSELQNPSKIQSTAKRCKKENENVSAQKGRGRPKGSLSKKSMAKQRLQQISDSRYKKQISVAKRIAETFENEEVTNNETFISGSHFVHPVYITPGLFNEGHTPIIIMQSDKIHYAKIDSSSTSSIQIQENVDNVLHEESIRLNEAVLDNSKDSNDVTVEKEDECLVQEEEFVPFENMKDEELLLGPWGEVLSSRVSPSSEGMDLQQLIEEDHIITVLESGCNTIGSNNDILSLNKHVTMTTDVLTSPTKLFSRDITVMSPFSSSMALETIRLNDCINEMGLTMSKEAETELVGGNDITDVTDNDQQDTDHDDQITNRDVTPTIEICPIVVNESSPITNSKAPSIAIETLPLVNSEAPFSKNESLSPIITSEACPINQSSDNTLLTFTKKKRKLKEQIKKKKVIYKIRKKKNDATISNGGHYEETTNQQTTRHNIKEQTTSPTPLWIEDINDHAHFNTSISAVDNVRLVKKTTPNRKPIKPINKSKNKKSDALIKRKTIQLSPSNGCHNDRRVEDVPVNKRDVISSGIENSSNNGCGQDNNVVRTIDPTCSKPFSFNLTNILHPNTEPSFRNVSLFHHSTPTNNSIFKIDNLVKTNVVHTNTSPIIPEIPVGFNDTLTIETNATPVKLNATLTKQPNAIKSDSDMDISKSLLSSPCSLLSNQVNNNEEKCDEFIIDTTDTISLFVDDTLDNIDDDDNSFKHTQDWVADQQRDPPPLPNTPSSPIPSSVPLLPIPSSLLNTRSPILPWAPCLSVPPSPIPPFMYTPTCPPPLPTCPPPPPTCPPPLPTCPPLPPTCPPPPPTCLPPPSTCPPPSLFNNHTLNSVSFGPPPRWSQARRTRQNSLFEPSPRASSVMELKLINPILHKLSAVRITANMIHEYVYDIRPSLLDKFILDIIVFLKALLHDDFSKAAISFMFLRMENNIRFTFKILTALLFLCSTVVIQSPSPTVTKLPSPVIIADKVFEDLRRIGAGRVDPLDYTNFMYTLANSDKINDLFVLYSTCGEYGIKIVPDHLYILVNKANLLGYRMLMVLNDAKFCLSDNELLRFSEHILDTVDRCVLLSCPHLLVNWIKSTPSIVKKLSLDKIELLLSVFVERSEWHACVTLLDCCSHMIPCLGKDLLKIIDSLSIPTCHETKYLMNFITKLSVSQVHQLPPQIWCKLLQCSLNLKLIETSCWLYKTATSLNEHVNNKMMLRLMSLLIDHNCPVPLFSILGSFLSRTDLEVAEFTQLCELCQADGFTRHLLNTCYSMIDHKLPPPLHSLNWLLNRHINNDKMFEELAELVKKASFNRVVLGYEFYERVLVELRSWGKDLCSLETVYKCLRRKHSINSDEQRNGGDEDPSSSGFGSYHVTQDGSTCSSISLSPLSDFGMGPSPVHQNDHLVTNTEETCCSIKQHGFQKQFGAVAAILIHLKTNQLYSRSILQSCVSLFLHGTNNEFNNKFELFVNSLKCARIAKNEIFNSHDRWLLGQVGVALLFHCDRTRQWKNGFLLLHCLHINGIHYVNIPPPHSVIPTPTPFSIAMKAVSTCLEIDQVTGALVVLRGCQFVKGNTEQENINRGHMLMMLATKCADNDLHDDACTCINNVLMDVPRPLYMELSNTVTIVLSRALDQELIMLSVGVVNNMMSKNILLECELCSRLVSKLINFNNNEEAQSIVNGAIGLGWYQQIETTPYSLVLPGHTITEMEINCLTWHHATTIMPHPPLHPLEVICSTDQQHDVERSLQTMFTPPLSITGRSSCSMSRVCLQISYQSLCVWTTDYHKIEKVKSKDKKKLYRRELCKTVADNMKCYYQEKRFASEDDYKHLISLVYNYFVSSSANTQWIMTNQIQDNIKDVVKKIMDSCTTYNKYHDITNMLSLH